RLGRKKTVKLYGGLSAALFILCGLTACLSNHWIALTLLLMPLAYQNGKSARANHETPVLFLPAIRGAIILYVIIMVILILGFPVVNLLEYR
ncbi:MAG: hypothetical protein Q8O57_10805, partial [Kiritimatiellota bacterium]|nr:hypothetical protein [Kiritimatiellota bacterium]